MSWYFTSEVESAGFSARDAGGKARSDVNALLERFGLRRLPVEVIADRESGSALKKLSDHRVALGHWLDAVGALHEGDGLVMQFPAVSHTVLFGKVVSVLKSRGVRLVLLIHDLESLRMAMAPGVSTLGRKRVDMEESAAISYASAIVVHNDHMGKVVAEQFGYPRDRLVSLGLFDYLIPGFEDVPSRFDDNAVAVAGNLSPEKAGYLYDLPSDVSFNLYGMNYSPDERPGNVSYHGSFPSEELPMALRGRFGLVWDGPSAATCEGVYGEYLRINNPHKTSLYLASGFPVAVWGESAVADVVRKEGAGICVDSLSELAGAMASVSPSRYERMRGRAAALGKRLREGGFTQAAVQRATAVAQR